MCLIGLAIDPPGPWLLVVAANRDEFHDRHAAPAAYWDADPQGLLAGRDLQGGGTWLGLRRLPGGSSIRLAALTNMRPGLMPEPAASLPGQPAVPPSRGQLVTGFLSASTAPEPFLRRLDPPAGAYAGFNLLTATLHRDGVRGAAGAGAAVAMDGWYLNNLPGAEPCRLGAGIHLASNASLDVAWPKTRLLRSALAVAIGGARGNSAEATTATQQCEDIENLRERLFDALADRTLAADPELPRTGLDHARERLLSAPFIVDDHYGTRCSTVIVVSRAGQVLFSERSFGPGGRRLGTVTERFALRADG